MCLAVPVKVIEVNNDTALIETEGVKREVNIALLENINVGDHIIVHAGFAIQKWDEEDVDDYNQLMDEMNANEEDS